MNKEIGYQPEDPTKAVQVDDWRWQEIVNMSPQVIMDELLGLSEEILDAKTEYEEVRFELRQARERLKLMEAQVLQAALDSEDKAVSDQVSGKNTEVRQRKAAIYLADHPTVKDLAHELRVTEALEVEARLAMEAALDRQKSLYQWARMFEAQVKLLSTVRAPETNLGELGRVIAQAYRLPFQAELDGVPVMIDREPVSEGEALDAMEAGGIEISTVDELFPPDVEIPPSMDVSAGEVDDLKAAVARHRAGGASDATL